MISFLRLGIPWLSYQPALEHFQRAPVEANVDGTAHLAPSEMNSRAERNRRLSVTMSLASPGIRFGEI